MGSVSDGLLEELAADRGAAPAAPPAGIPNPSAPVDPGAHAQQDGPENRGGVLARLAVAVLAAGLWGHGARVWEIGNRRPGRLLDTGKSR
jgi:hypothetical protein